jgi:hypothetical protein
MPSAKQRDYAAKRARCTPHTHTQCSTTLTTQLGLQQRAAKACVLLSRAVSHARVHHSHHEGVGTSDKSVLQHCCSPLGETCLTVVRAHTARPMWETITRDRAAASTTSTTERSKPLVRLKVVRRSLPPARHPRD